jgi:hypothetical protein
MFLNRFRHLLPAEHSSRIMAGCPEAFVPVALPANQLPWVQELYRLAAEQTRVQLAPPRHLLPSLFSAN